MQNNSLADMITDDLAKGICAQRDERVRKAIDFALKREDWAPEQVKAMGICEYHNYSDGTEVFAVNGIDMIEFYPATVRTEGFCRVATQHYRVLCPELEVYLA